MKKFLTISLGLFGLLGTGSALAVERERVICHNQEINARGVYSTKRYPEAEEALRRAGFKVAAPTPRPPKTGCTLVYEPQPAVKHAAEVDMPPRKNGGGLCKYLQQPQVTQWYQKQFGIQWNKASVHSC